MNRDPGAVLKNLLPAEAILSGTSIQDWRTGPGVGGVPAAVVAPASVEELGEVMKAAVVEGWKVLPAGRGQWLQGGGPTTVDVVVTTRRMQDIVEYEPADLTITAGAGLTMGSLDEATRPHGQWLPLDPPGGRGGSLGALLSVGAWGPLRYGYGTARDHVLGLTMVSGEGKTLRWGGRVVKNVAGFDLTRLCIGSWGTLGVITSVSTRLFPVPRSDRTLILSGDAPADLVPMARGIARMGLPLAALELTAPFPPLGIEGMVLQGGEARSTATQTAQGSEDEGGRTGAALIIRLMGGEEAVEAMDSRIRSTIGSAADHWSILEGEASRAFHHGVEGWEEGAALVLRLSLLPSKLEILLQEVDGLKRLVSSSVSSSPAVDLWSHVGSGVTRVAVRGLAEDPAVAEEWSRELRTMRERIEIQGGSLTLSQGHSEILEAVGVWGATAGQQGLLKGLKGQFDPEGVLAPGRLGL
jgi:glycolate oxidase FAD binding subunit